MNTSGAFAPMIDARVAQVPQTDQDRATVNRFVNLAVRGLVPMFDRQQGLFCYKLKKTAQGMVQEGVSQRYTAMTLMGLHRLEQAGAVSPLDTNAILQALLSDLEWANNIGDLGASVALWCGLS
jgi:hypothetical protein